MNGATIENKKSQVLLSDVKCKIILKLHLHLKIYLTVLLTVTLFFTSYDKDFEETNTSKTDFIALDPVFKLNKAIINLMEMVDRVQQLQNAYWLTSPFGSSLAGAN